MNKIIENIFNELGVKPYEMFRFNNSKTLYRLTSDLEFQYLNKSTIKWKFLPIKYEYIS